MKSYEIKPTHENLVNAFCEDILNRNRDVFKFAEILNSLENGCSISLDGSWGSGKTFFVRQVKMFLDANNEFFGSINEDDKCVIIGQYGRKTTNAIDFKPQVSVYYDAWENDNDEDPVLSLIYAILKNVNEDFSIDNDTSCIQIASNILQFFTGKDWNKLIDSFRSQDPLSELKKAKTIEEEIKKFLDALLAERGDRLVVFVDELDRCKPIYAVRLLERIKHYFDNDRITFVFSINTNELQHTIKRYYGDDFDACRYLDRFFDLRISLPPVNLANFYRSISFDDGYVYDKMCKEVINKYNLSLREIAKYVKLTKIAAFNPTHGDQRVEFEFPEGKALKFCLTFIVPIMIGLRLVNSNQYERFVQGKDATPLLDFADNVIIRRQTSLLTRKESFDPEDKDKTVVTVEDKLKQVYNALFNTDYDGVTYDKQVGEYEFRKDTKETIFRTASLLSKFADFEVD